MYALETRGCALCAGEREGVCTGEREEDVLARGGGGRCTGKREGDALESSKRANAVGLITNSGGGVNHVVYRLPRFADP